MKVSLRKISVSFKLQSRLRSLFLFSPRLCSFFKKRQQEKRLRRPRSDGDAESVEDVDDEEFEKLLGELL